MLWDDTSDYCIGLGKFCKNRWCVICFQYWTVQEVLNLLHLFLCPLSLDFYSPKSMLWDDTSDYCIGLGTFSCKPKYRWIICGPHGMLWGFARICEDFGKIHSLPTRHGCSLLCQVSQKENLTAFKIGKYNEMVVEHLKAVLNPWYLQI